MGERKTANLVIDAMVMAVGRRNPTDPLLHHSDKGSTYTAMSFTQRLDDLGLFPSEPSVWRARRSGVGVMARSTTYSLGASFSATVASTCMRWIPRVRTSCARFRNRTPSSNCPMARAVWRGISSSSWSLMPNRS
jgi:hypothetical protein